MKVNAEIYQNIAENIDFKIIQKISQNQFQLESLLFGKGNLLEKETETNQKWKREFEFLKTKFKISEQTFPPKIMVNALLFLQFGFPNWSLYFIIFNPIYFPKF